MEILGDLEEILVGSGLIKGVRRMLQLYKYGRVEEGKSLWPTNLEICDRAMVYDSVDELL